MSKEYASWKADQKVTSVGNGSSLHAIVYTWEEAVEKNGPLAGYLQPMKAD
jgi:hypothetical protein